MSKTISMTTDMPADRQVHIVLPNDVPTGPAEIVIIVASHSKAGHTLGDLAQSPFFGMWRDRTDIGDSAESARRLRARD